MRGQSAKTEPIHIHPLVLKSSKKAIHLSKGVSLRRIDTTFIRRALGLKSVSVDPRNGMVKEFSPSEGPASLKMFMARARLGRMPTYIPENFFLCVKFRPDAERFKQAVLLNARTGSVPGWGISDPSAKGPWIQTFNQVEIRWPELLELDDDTIRLVRRTFKSLESMTSDRERLILAKFVVAEAKLPGGAPMNIFEHVSLQELVLLPNSSTELRFRYSLRMAKLLERYFSEDPTETYNFATKLYDVRSRIAHSGSCKEGEEFLKKASDASRKVVQCFINHRAQFSDVELTALCLTG